MIVGTAPDQAVRVVDGHRHLGSTHGTRGDAVQVLAEMDANGVAASVLVPALRHIAVDNREGNDEVLAAAASSRGRLIPMCSVNPWYGSRAVTEFRRAATAGAVALKLHPALQGFCLTDRLVHAVVKEADTLGLPIYVHTGTPPYAQPLQLAELARTFAQVTFVMGHAGSTDLAADAVAAAELAGNIVVETSWTLPARLVRMVESLGSSRVMFGSDAPFSDLSLEIFNHRAAELSPEDMNAVMGLTALRLFGPTR